MKKVVFNLMLLVVLMLGVTASQAWAQNKPLNGKWVFTVVAPQGSLPFAFTFKKNGKGTAALPTGNFQLAYREDGATFSFSIELPKTSGLPAPLAPSTVIVRGSKSDDNTASGLVLLISDTKDPNSPFMFGGGVSTFTAKRQ